MISRDEFIVAEIFTGKYDKLTCQDARILIDELYTRIDRYVRSCKGCIHLGKFDNEIEYGYNSPCTNCSRRCNDNYKSKLSLN